MSKTIPKIMPGFMELLPEDQILFNNIIDTIRETYESFGFLPLDTPILEYSDVLLAKAGGETEKQIYRFEKGDTDISLRFDLTVPLARYVSMRYNDLVFPFKRYQIGKVYRGERPQKGRFREFYQCDIDMIGEDLSFINDSEILTIIYSLFKKLDFGKFTIRINNRKILNGFFESLSLTEQSSDVLRIIDKIDKIGVESVKEELLKLSLDNDTISKIIDFISIKGSNEEVFSSIKELNINNSTFNEGIEELKFVTDYLDKFGFDRNYYKIDLTIARGLDYYTGTIYETILDEHPSLGSICSGGRYGGLTKHYIDKEFDGIGISIGITRLFSVLLDLGIIKPTSKTLSKALVVPFTSENISHCSTIANTLRENGIKCEVYYEDKAFKKKLNYANRLGIPYVIIIGDDEENNNQVTIKNMETGDQQTINKDKILEVFKEEV